MSTFTFEEPRLLRLIKLMELLRDGRIAVPGFQRPPIWPAARRLKLLDSVFRGYPVGSIFLWRDPRNDAPSDMPRFGSIGPWKVPPAAQTVRNPDWLIDGHQRLAVLFAFFGPGLFPQSGAPEWDQRFLKSDWEAWFDLDAGGPEEDLYKDSPDPIRRERSPGGHFVLRGDSKEEPQASRYVPLGVLLNPVRLQQRIAALSAARRSELECMRLVNLADRFRETLLPVVYLSTDDLRIVLEAYARINEEATSIEEKHLIKVFAWTRSGPAPFDIEREGQDLANTSFSPLWRTFAQEWMIDACKLVLGVPLYRGNPRTLASKLDRGVMEQAADLLARGVRLVEAQSVLGDRSLPYALQVLVGGLVDWRRRDQGGLPDRIFARWFWATTVCRTLAGVYDQSLDRLIRHLEEFADGRQSQPIPPDLAVSERFPRFDFRSARSRGQALLLAQRVDHIANEGRQDHALGLAIYGNDGVKRLFPVAPTNAPAAVRRASRGIAAWAVVARPDPTQWDSMDAIRQDLVLQGAHLTGGDGSPEETLYWREGMVTRVERMHLESLGLFITFSDEPDPA